MPVSKMTVNEAKQELDKLIDRAVGGERTIIVANGMPQAVVVSLTDYAKIERTDATSNGYPHDRWLGNSPITSQRESKHRERNLLDVKAAVDAAREALSKSNRTIE